MTSADAPRPGTPDHPLRVAVIGSGPAGFYVVQELLQSAGLQAEVDMFDRLPTPFGLVRSGVAPDHPKIKSVANLYDRLASKPGYRFFGNVEFGRDVDLEDLTRHYGQIVFASGAQADRALDIPGEDLTGVHSARHFVAWYNGDPDYSHLHFDFEAKAAAVVGVGNVAADVARILCRAHSRLAQTDIADYALDALHASSIQTVYVLGRRGPVQSRFSPPEIKELGELLDCAASTLPEEMELDPFSREELEQGPREVRQKYDELLAMAGREEPQKPKKLIIRFMASPVEILGDGEGRVRGIRIVRNELYRADDGTVRSRATDHEETLDVGLVFRSVGYRGVSLPGLPFDRQRGVVPNEAGRIIDPESNLALPGLYVSGWIKRGPTGLIGANKGCARETVQCMVHDLEQGRLLRPDDDHRGSIERLLEERNVRYLTYEDWKRLDEIERQRGEAEGRPRVKITEREEMLRAIERDSARKR